MSELWQTYELATANEGRQFDETERHYIRTYATYAYQTVRHWILPGMLGAWYGQMHKLGGLTEDNKDPMLIVGSGHAPDEERLRRLNIGVRAHHTEHGIYPEREWAKVFKRGVGEARLSHAEAATPLPF